jgi:hypothetical protein
MGMAMNMRKPRINGRLKMKPAVDSLFTHALKEDLFWRILLVDKAASPPYSEWKKRGRPEGALFSNGPLSVFHEAFDQ